MSAGDGLTRDAFLGGRLSILQPATGYRAGIDPVLLAAAVPARPGDRVLDLGCGVGVASLCLAARVPGLALAGLELQPLYADLARRNAAGNGIPLDVVEGDVTDPPRALLQSSFDHVIANPPFFRTGSGSAAGDDGRRLARAEAVPLALWVDAATRRLAPRGRLTVIQRASRLGDLLTAVDSRLGSIQIRPIAARYGRDAHLVIISVLKGGRADLRLLPPLILHEGDGHEADRGSYRAEIQDVLRQGAPLPQGAAATGGVRSPRSPASVHPPDPT